MIPSSFSPVVPDIDPKAILDMNYAFARTAMLVAAVRLHIFTFLSDKELTPAALVAIAQTEPGLMEQLLIGLWTLGMVEREGVPPEYQHTDRIDRAACEHVTVKEGAL